MLILFEELEDKKKDLKIGHFEISQSPLKEVFERIVAMSD